MSDAAASPPWDLLARQLAGEATPADEAAVRAWQAAAPANAALWQQLTGVWTDALPAAAAPVFGAADTARAWHHFETNVLGPPAAPPANPTPAAPPSPPAGVPGASNWAGLASWGKVATLLVGGVGAGWLLRTAMPPVADMTTSPTAIISVAPPPAGAPSAAPSAAATVDLVFENEEIRSVARRLEAAFPGTRVAVTDSAVAAQRFTGTFRATRPAVVLRVVGVTTGAALSQQPDSVWVLRRAAE